MPAEIYIWPMKSSVSADFQVKVRENLLNLVSLHPKLYNKRHNEYLDSKVKDKILYVLTIYTKPELRKLHADFFVLLQNILRHVGDTRLLENVLLIWDRW